MTKDLTSWMSLTRQERQLLKFTALARAHAAQAVSAALALIIIGWLIHQWQRYQSRCKNAVGGVEEDTDIPNEIRRRTNRSVRASSAEQSHQPTAVKRSSAAVPLDKMKGD